MDEMMQGHGEGSAEGSHTRFWSIMRLLLGQLQIAGVVGTAIYLLNTGVSTETMCLLSVTTLLTLVSILLFRICQVQREQPR